MFSKRKGMEALQSGSDQRSTLKLNDEKIVVSIIIISFNTRQLTLDCLRSVRASVQGMPTEVWVVDNASTDGGVEAIRAEFPEVRLIANARNVGFGPANNQAMRVANGEFFLLLNSDAFLEQDAVNELVAFLRESPKIGVVGPRLLNADGSLQVSCFRFPSPSHAWCDNLWLTRGYGRWKHDSVRRVDFVSGACMLVRREVFEETGGFDEQFFMYSEESDWQRRIWNAGWQVAFTPSARVVHLGGASGADQKAEINRYFFDSLDQYLHKHHGVLGLISLRCAMTIGCALRAGLWALVSLLPHKRTQSLISMRRHLALLKRQTTHWPAFSKRAKQSAQLVPIR